MSERHCSQTTFEIIILYSFGCRSKRESLGNAVDDPDATLSAKHIWSRGFPLPNMQAWKTKITYQQLYTLILYPSVVRALFTCSFTIFVANAFLRAQSVSLLARPTARHASGPRPRPRSTPPLARKMVWYPGYAFFYPLNLDSKFSGATRFTLPKNRLSMFSAFPASFLVSSWINATRNCLILTQ